MAWTISKNNFILDTRQLSVESFNNKISVETTHYDKNSLDTR